VTVSGISSDQRQSDGAGNVALPRSQHLTPIPRKSVAEEIVSRLTGFILDEELKVGDRLPSEKELIARLAVGRSSLREAIKVLSGVGVIQVVRGGMFVGGGDSSILSKPFAWAFLLGQRSTQEVVEARRAVEVELAGLAAKRATQPGLATIEQHLAGMRENTHDGVQFSLHDLEFHMAVAHAADNRVLAHLLETMRNVVWVWIEKVIGGNHGQPRSYAEHIPIYEAIRARDADGARAAMAAHLDAAAARLFEVS